MSLVALLLLEACKLELGPSEEVHTSVKQAELQSSAAGGSVLTVGESWASVRYGCNPASANCGEKGMSCSEVCRGRQDTPRHDFGRALPQPELRRQVGVRWPQHDLVVSVTALCASLCIFIPNMNGHS